MEFKTYDEAVEALMEYFTVNEEDFNEAIESLDSWNGYLGDDRYYSMDELDEIYSGTEPTEILYRAFYGHDEDSYTTDSRGNKEYGQFNPNRNYFYFNGYGNLVSADYKDYSDKLDDYAIREMIDNRDEIDLASISGELEEICDAINNIGD